MICGKHAFLTPQEAQRDADRQERAGREHQHPYRCPDCGFYHLTRTRQGGDWQRYVRETTDSGSQLTYDEWKATRQ
jgi:hypothetical protein